MFIKSASDDLFIASSKLTRYTVCPVLSNNVRIPAADESDETTVVRKAKEMKGLVSTTKLELYLPFLSLSVSLNVSCRIGIAKPVALHQTFESTRSAKPEGPEDMGARWSADWDD